MRLPRRSARGRPYVSGRPASERSSPTGRPARRPSGTRSTAAPRSAPSRRPTVQRSTAGAVPRPRETPAGRSRRSGLTARAAVLAVAVCAVVLTLAVPLQQYVAQHGRIDALAAQTRDQERRVAQLEAARQRWEDPAYIRQQARERLHFVEPGETAYVVVAPSAGRSATTRPVSSTQATSDSAPWYSELWQSVVAAGSPPPPPTKAPLHHRRAKPRPITADYAHPKG